MKIRIISAIVVIAILLPLLLVGGVFFAAAMGILAILAYKEMIELKTAHHEVPNLIKIIGLLVVIFMTIGYYRNPSDIFTVNYAQIILPLLVFLIPAVFYKNDKYTTKDAFYLTGFSILIGLFFNLLIGIRNIPGENSGIHLMFYLLSITIFTDTFAYIIGILIGKHKMCPDVSPKKSWEGTIAGLIGGSIVALIVYSNLINAINFEVVIITLILSALGQIGDLIFSKIKRENKIKDFSNIMPGHGGVLDRVDSLVIVVFAYILLTRLF